MQILALVILSSIIGFPVALAQSAVSNTTPPGVPHRRQYFYVGGEYIPGGTSQIAHGQMYVEHLVPSQVNQTVPLVFIHGLGMTGTNFLNTPDGRIGWADHFMSLGYEVCVALFIKHFLSH
jgi:pimeloyl-ACP methyl ester carboxylesterase